MSSLAKNTKATVNRASALSQCASRHRVALSGFRV